MTQILSKNPNPRELSDRINLILDGKLNNTGTVTLTPSQTTTTVIDPRIHENSAIFLSPQTSSAATGNTPYILAANITSGQFIITHSSSGSSDKTFLYTFLG